MITGVGATERLAAYIQATADFIYIANGHALTPSYIDLLIGIRYRRTGKS